MSSEPSSPIVKIYVVRHGETNENREGIIQGQMDTKLNEDGMQQAALVAERFKDVPLVAAFSSDLERARKTAEAILKHHPSVRLIAQPELRERFMGDLQGVKAGHGMRGKMSKSTQVETGKEFTERIQLWWDTTIANHLPAIPLDIDIMHVLVVSHGAFIATLVKTLGVERIIVEATDFDLPPTWSCFNTSVTTIEMGKDKRGVLRTYSDISHLVMPVVQTNVDERPQG